MKRRNAAIVAAVLLATVQLPAHDFWLASVPWEAAPGARMTVTANVGDRFPEPTSFTAPERVDRLRLVGPAGELPVSPSFRRDQNSLAAEIVLPSKPGTYVVVMTIKPRFIEIKPPDFATYLRHEGLQRIVEERERHNETERPGRERYSRYAKLMLRAGESGGAHVSRPIGLRAELVPQSDPTTLRIGDTLRLRLLAEGEPVAGALVGGIYAASKGAPDDWPLKARTDQNGEATFVVEHAGPWLFRSVHMVRAREPGSPAAEWESSWASLAFAVVPDGR